MGIVERISNPAAATRMLGRVITKQFSGRDMAWARPAPSQRGGATAATATERSDMSYGDPSSARRLTKIVAAAVAQSANIIGITGAHPGVGVSVTSRQLAGAFANYGAKTLLVDVSRADISSSAPAGAPLSFMGLMTEVRPFLAVVDLVAAQDSGALTSDGLRTAFAEATKAGYTIVVDLPPVVQPSGQPTPFIVDGGTACDLVFLVLLSGNTKRSEVTECVDTCKIIGLKLGGVILNDWRLPASSILES